MSSDRPEAEPRGAKIHGNRPVDQSEAANRFIAATEHEKMHDERLWDMRQKRDREMHGLPEWEELRNLASAIKEHTLTRLDEYLEQFEANARANGMHVHWAKDAAEHNEIVLGILRDHGAKRLIKSKSMLTEECNFREFMAEHDDRDHRDRSWRAHPATRRGGAQPRRGARRPQAALRRGAGVRREARLRSRPRATSITWPSSSARQPGR